LLRLLPRELRAGGVEPAQFAAALFATSVFCTRRGGTPPPAVMPAPPLLLAIVTLSSCSAVWPKPAGVEATPPPLLPLIVELVACTEGAAKFGWTVRPVPVLPLMVTRLRLRLTSMPANVSPPAWLLAVVLFPAMVLSVIVSDSPE